MVILIRCNDVVSDPRAMKYVQYLRSNNIEHVSIGWDREQKCEKQDDIIYFNIKAGYNVGGIKAAFNRLKWMIFVMKTLRKYRKNESIVIHGCDLDAAFPASIFKQYYNPSSKVIFDIFDWFSDTLHRQKKWLIAVFKYMEKISIKNSDYVIICELERIKQIPYPLEKKNISVLPNIPNFSDNSFLHKEKEYSFDNSKITFAYVGGFSVERCINEIISLAQSGKINLLIAGFGNAQIERRLRDLSDCQYIKYFGKVKYTIGLNIMYNADVIYAMYATSNPNHIYAAPNKYYEAMFLGKPIFTTKGTIVESKVLRNKIGFVSCESQEGISNTIDAITIDAINEFGESASNLWKSKYCSFTEDFLNNEYFDLIFNKSNA